MPAMLAPFTPLSRLNEVPTSPLQLSPGSPPLGSAENGITSTAQGRVSEKIYLLGVS